MVPGFDFLQNLVKGAGAAMPGVGQWIAPTLDPDELDKRIGELRTVQFWLEQNARLLGTTIQALEVQRMTLSTLRTMNVSFGDLTESLKIRMPGAGESAAAAPQPAARATPRAAPQDAPQDTPPAAPQRAPHPAPPPATAARSAPGEAAAAGPAPAAAGTPPAVDPMQWWGALTQQFTELAAKALREGSAATQAATEVAQRVATEAAAAGGKAMAAADALGQAVGRAGPSGMPGTPGRPAPRGSGDAAPRPSANAAAKRSGKPAAPSRRPPARPR
jgi:hypothetical protein